jgi:hypothetical protein
MLLSKVRKKNNQAKNNQIVFRNQFHKEMERVPALVKSVLIGAISINSS